MVQQTSEVRLSTQMGLNQVDDFADRTGGAPSQEDVDVPYQMRPQIQHNSQNQLHMARQENSNTQPRMTPNQEQDANGAVIHAEIIRKQSASGMVVDTQ